MLGYNNFKYVDFNPHPSHGEWHVESSLRTPHHKNFNPPPILEGGFCERTSIETAHKKNTGAGKPLTCPCAFPSYVVDAGQTVEPFPLRISFSDFLSAPVCPIPAASARPAVLSCRFPCGSSIVLPYAVPAWGSESLLGLVLLPRAD